MVIRIPGVQYPHWSAWWRRKAAWSGECAPSGAGEAFHGVHAPPVRLDGEDQTGAGWCPVEAHRARPADAVLAPDVHAPPAEPLAKEVAEEEAGRRLRRASLPVQHELDEVTLAGGQARAWRRGRPGFLCRPSGSAGFPPAPFHRPALRTRHGSCRGRRYGTLHRPPPEGADEATAIRSSPLPVVDDVDLPRERGEGVVECASPEPRPFADDGDGRGAAEADDHPVLVEDHRTRRDREVAVAECDLVEGVPRAPRGGRPAGRDHHLVLPARGLEGAFEERARRNQALAAGRRAKPDRTVQHREGEGKLRARVRMRDGAAHRSARPGRVVPDVRQGIGEDRQAAGEAGPALKRRLGDPCPHLDLRTLVRDPAELLDPANVDHHRRAHHPEVHHRDEGEPAREDPGVVPRLPEDGDRLLDGGRAGIVEGSRLHEPSLVQPIALL